MCLITIFRIRIIRISMNLDYIKFVIVPVLYNQDIDVCTSKESFYGFFLTDFVKHIYFFLLHYIFN